MPAGRAQSLRDRRAIIGPGMIDAKVKAMQRAPDDKGPGGAVPEAAEQHRDHQVHIAQQRAMAVAAERNVEIVAQELRQASCASGARSR